MVDCEHSTVKVVSVDPSHPRPDRVLEAVQALEREEVLALPTETFYGLAVDSQSRAALGRINRIKRKPEGSPILLLLADRFQAATLAARLPDPFADLAGAFWPGPLTLVVPAAPGVPDEITGGTGTVALRVPGLALPRELARALGRPITGPSANRHGEPPCRTAGEVADSLGAELDGILDGGATSAGAPSTVLDLAGRRPRVIREGLLRASSLLPFLSRE